jgi:hypothetical protein
MQSVRLARRSSACNGLCRTATSTVLAAGLSALQAAFPRLGAPGPYVGDIECALHIYEKPLRVMYGPILYAGGQLAIALSTLL